MSSDHARFCYSRTCQTDGPAVLHCLRALCQFAEKGKKPRIGWGGAGEADWRGCGDRLVLRFTASSHRQVFAGEANRLLLVNGQ